MYNKIISCYVELGRLYYNSMEVDQRKAGSSVLTSMAGSVSVSLHPLVIMNISDHFTRVTMQQESSEGVQF